MSDITALMTQRRNLTSKLSTYEEAVDLCKTKNADLNTCREFEKKLDAWLLKLEENLEEIGKLCYDDDTTYTTHEDEFKQLCRRRTEAKMVLFSCPAFNITPQPQNNSNNPPTPVNQKQTVHLPKLNLPKFNGKEDNWLQFHDMFTSAIHNNSNLNGIQKLQYLTSLLEDEPASLIRHIPISNNSFTSAWKTLTDRYHNPNVLVEAQLTKLFQLPSVSNCSAASLRNLIDTAQACKESLGILSVNVTNLDIIFLFAVKRQLDRDTRLQWDIAAATPDTRTFHDLAKFINKRADSLAIHGGTDSQQHQHNSSDLKSKNGKKSNTTVSHLTSTKPKCGMCKGEGHYASRCDKFRALTTEQRRETVKNNKMCFVCLGTGHSAGDCTFDWKCRTCQGKHHSLIHLDPSTAPKEVDVPPPEPPPSTTITAAHACEEDDVSPSQQLLATALVQIQTLHGDFRIFRALIDSGSEASFISKKAVQILGLNTCVADVLITGIGESNSGSSQHKVHLTLGSCHGNLRLETEAFVLPKVTRRMPKSTFNYSGWTHIEDLPLADPTFYKSAAVDLLLGVEIVAKIKKDGVRTGPVGTPTAENSAFGWLLYGPLRTGVSNNLITVNSNHAVLKCFPKSTDLEQQKSRSTILAIMESHGTHQLNSMDWVSLRTANGLLRRTWYFSKLPFIDSGQLILNSNSHGSDYMDSTVLMDCQRHNSVNLGHPGDCQLYFIPPRLAVAEAVPNYQHSTLSLVSSLLSSQLKIWCQRAKQKLNSISDFWTGFLPAWIKLPTTIYNCYSNGHSTHK